MRKEKKLESGRWSGRADPANNDPLDCKGWIAGGGVSEVTNERVLISCDTQFADWSERKTFVAR